MTAIFMVLGALSGGLGGALIFLGISVALTGLYVVLTGRRSWAWLPAKRKAGGVAIAASLALLIGGAVALPRVTSADLEAASAESRATGPAATASLAAPAVAAPSSTPVPAPTTVETGESLEPDAPKAVAAGVTVAAPNTQPDYATKAIDLLATLAVKGRAPKTGYDRAQFGHTWADVDRNGCDTRNDILKRDLTRVTFTNNVPCKVQSGTLSDPYTGTTISFLRGAATSTAVQIDHVVALSDAWQKGA